MNVFNKEIRSYLKPIIFWSLGMIALIASGMGKYAAGSSSGTGAAGYNALLQSMPKSIQTLFGLNIFDASKVSGFYGILFPFILLTTAIHAAMLGADIISKEERDKTSEFLFVKPRSRSSILAQKLLAALVEIVILNLVALFSSIAILNAFKTGEAVNGDILKLMLGMFIVQLIFLAIGAGIAAMAKKPKKAVGAATAVILTTYFLSLFIDLAPSLDALKYLTPFKYFEAANLMYGGDFSPVYIIISVFIIGIFTVLAFRKFQQRDLNI